MVAVLEMAGEHGCLWVVLGAATMWAFEELLVFVTYLMGVQLLFIFEVVTALYTFYFILIRSDLLWKVLKLAI